MRICGVGNKQRSFHNKGVKITDRVDEKASAPVRFSHESVSKLVGGWVCYSKTEFMPDCTKDCELMVSGWRRAEKVLCA